MSGYCAPYVPGWDNHGMPIENAVAKKFREAKQIVDRVVLRQACREYAKGWVETQRGQFKRLGVRGDWNDPYLTMSREFEAEIVAVFGELAQKGFIYRGLKPVLWCATCETALADAEVEYEPHTSNSIYVRFPLWEDPRHLYDAPEAAPVHHGHREAGVPRYALIWTTTPWTIPANLALAVHPEADYAFVLANRSKIGAAQARQESAETRDPAIERENADAPDPATEAAYYLVAAPLVEDAMRAAGITEFEVVGGTRGAELAGMIFQHPLFHRTSPVVLADYVTMDAGTGIVHTAPGHGKEDFETGQKYGLEVLNPVDASGRYTAQAGEYAGQKFEGLRVTTVGDSKGKDAEANVVMIDVLQAAGALLSASKFEHSYPHCWRCHSPLVFRATVQWFMNIDHEGHREKCLQAIDGVKWFPAESRNRITSMVGGRPDWCVSRQRSWGVGIPAFYCEACGEAVLTPESVGAVVELVRRASSDAWYDTPPTDILPPGFVCPHCQSPASRLRKETDVLDVWFDSGSTNRAVLENTAHWPHLRRPADVYLEGGDQHRGWFNSSLMIGVATRQTAPYKQVVTNGWALDESGRAMHKSLGNVVNPLTVIEKYGADILRWWVGSTNFMEDVSLGDNTLKQVSETYRRVRNTFRFLLNNLYDFDPARDSVADADLEELDRWILAQLDRVTVTATAAYDVYEFHRASQAVHNFCTVELSSFYLDVLKDRLYASGAKSPERRSAQTAMHRIADALARLLAPILAHTAEEVWDYLKPPDKAESVHLADFPTPAASDELLLARWEPVLAARETVKKAIEEARQAGTVGNPLESRVALTVDSATYHALAPFADQLQTLFLVSQVTLREAEGAGEPGAVVTVDVSAADGVKCARCWLYKTDVGADAAYPDLCARCAGVVGALQPVPAPMGRTMPPNPPAPFPAGEGGA